MPQITPPQDLIDLRIQRLHADTEHRRILATLPSGETIAAAVKAARVAGLDPRSVLVITDEQEAESRVAYQRILDLSKAIQGHDWWRTQASRADADKALTEVAQAQLAADQVPASA
jgi:hypothetical protein